eukprot:scaffold581861_cov41-Prasinocladus_malaysianus.AAC.1
MVSPLSDLERGEDSVPLQVSPFTNTPTGLGGSPMLARHRQTRSLCDQDPEAGSALAAWKHIGSSGGLQPPAVKAHPSTPSQPGKPSSAMSEGTRTPPKPASSYNYETESGRQTPTHSGPGDSAAERAAK